MLSKSVRINEEVTQNSSGIWTSSLDIKENDIWHFSAIEFHSLKKDTVILRRNAVFAILSCL